MKKISRITKAYALSRRSFLYGSAASAAGLWLPACGRDTSIDTVDSDDLEPSSEDRFQIASSCTTTEANPQGPFFKGGAPNRYSMVDGSAGTPLTLKFYFLGSDNCLWVEYDLNIWHASPSGSYDMENYTHRLAYSGGAATRHGKLFYTVMPGRYYDSGIGRYRPSHIHVRLEARSHDYVNRKLSFFEPLTTQLYFPGDPYNAGDPFFKPSLLFSSFFENPAGSGNYYASKAITLKKFAEIPF